ncbi:hypothetical protein C8Q78DRAFT_975030 [Trametes maxima]|nr:hypothetical protein C8Q78DRAFT_975030 [Trametes maxima]
MASVESVPAYLLSGVSVSQPPHLEGDPSLATEILPGPPSLGSIQQAGLPRKDHKKAGIIYSYLPASDPGTTYSSHIASILPAVTTVDMDGSRRKRTRLDKSVSERNRSQRASARNLAVGVTLPDPIAASDATASSSQLVPDYDPLSLPLDSDDAMVSRATTAHAEDTPPESSSVTHVKRGRGRPTKDSGKGKERERDGVVKVKEEPTVVLLGNEAGPSLSNEDHCSACRSLGSLVYCDGCPRAFHLWCLDPPMESADLPEGERWFCPACVLEQRPPPKPPTSLKFMGTLVHELNARIPSEYQLPQDIRTHFKDVGSSARGTYLDTSEIKQARLNRHGQLEDRDPYRLRDRNGDPVLCFQCGNSALPPALVADSPTIKRARRAASSSSSSNHDTGRAIISCDYCHLHWHLDCLDPPLVFMPPWNKKWMCPNHADRILQPKHRIPRANATPIEITKPRQWNNGVIEIVNTDAAPLPAVVPQKLNVDEVLINGRRYRVPEKIITLDFWDKVSKGRGGQPDTREIDDSSRMSSPLTSLSELDDDDHIQPMSMEPAVYSLDDVRFAQLLCGLRLRNASTAGEERSMSHSSSLHSSSLPRENPRVNGVGPKVKQEDDATRVSLSIEALVVPDQAVPSGSGPSAMTSSRTRRTAASRTPATARSRSTRRSGRTTTEEVSLDIDFPQLVYSSGKRPDARRKAARPLEASDHVPSTTPSVANLKLDQTVDTAEAPLTSVSVKHKRGRQATRRQVSPVPATTDIDTAVSDTDQPLSQQVKRELPAHVSKTSTTALSMGKRKANGTADSSAPRNHAKVTTPSKANGQAAATSTEHKAEVTPTLKIRLPRLSALTSPSVAIKTTTSDAASKSSPTKVGASSGSSRPRRSLRRQTSIPTSLNSAATSDATTTSRADDKGVPISPVESF